jgi:hypothetical protein
MCRAGIRWTEADTRGPSDAWAFHRILFAATRGLASGWRFPGFAREESGFKTGWAHDATVWWQLQPAIRSTFRKFVLYSRHNVLAGQQRYWHYGVARQYAVWLLMIIIGLLVSKWFLLIPAVGLAARVAKGLWQRREQRGLWWVINPVRFAMVAGIVLTIDLATFVGWGQALLARPLARAPQENEAVAKWH